MHRELATQKRQHIGATWRAILIGTALTIPNVYWILDSAGQGYPTTISLYYNVIFCIFIIHKCESGIETDSAASGVSTRANC